MERNSLSARELIEGSIDGWINKLVDISAKNLLLYFKERRNNFGLDAADAIVVEALLAGKAVRSSKLFPDADERKKSQAPFSLIRRTARSLADEQGIDVCYLAHGFIEVAPVAGVGKPAQALCAPILLRPLRISLPSAVAGDFELESVGPAELNTVLTYGLKSILAADIDIPRVEGDINAIVAKYDDSSEQLAEVGAYLTELLSSVGLAGQWTSRVVVGIFNFAKFPMIEDLRGSVELLASHDVITAIAGEKVAQQRLGQSSTAAPTHIDDIQPAAEYLVLDADSSQQQAINAALSGQHIVIDGPPGTGKSQTIANLIAASTAQGRKVLFVAEKRAAIDAVMDRLADCGVERIVFDLHRDNLTAKQAAEQLRDALDQAAEQQAVDVREIHQTVTARRDRLRSYVASMHGKVQPWDRTPYEVFTAVKEIPVHCHTDVRLGGRTLDNLVGERVSHVRESLMKFVELGGLRVVRGESPWSKSTITTVEQVREVLITLEPLAATTLRAAQDVIGTALAAVGLRQPGSFQDWREVLFLLEGVKKRLEVFLPEVYSSPLDEWHYAFTKRTMDPKQSHQLNWWRRRAVRKLAMSTLVVPGATKNSAMPQHLADAMGDLQLWRNWSHGNTGPQQVANLTALLGDFDQVSNDLRAVALSASYEQPQDWSTGDAQSFVQEAIEDRQTLEKLPSLALLRSTLKDAGIWLLVEQCAQTDADAPTAAGMFDWTLHMSLLEEFRLRNPELTHDSSDYFNRTVSEFIASDRAHIASTPHRMLRERATLIRQAREHFPEQADLVKRQAAKKRGQLPLRTLIKDAKDVIFAAKPCWAMSPLLVSKILPAQRLFDLVIFDEASQIRPHDAVTSIMRGTQLVVAGDDKQLPPTNVFEKMLADESDGDEDELDNFESILGALNGWLPGNYRLKWHYRSQDERLIAFSNMEIYNGELTTFPGRGKESPIRLNVVDGRSTPGQNGSAPEEVDHVVELVADHAQRNPERSLGVITMGSKHMERIEAALAQRGKEDPTLADFVNADKKGSTAFFVKNLESVQGDERDDIILSIGYAKDALGRLPQRFGEINKEGGERRINVAITRARKNMIVVSSFEPGEIQAEKAKNSGPELLRKFLDFAARGGNYAAVGSERDVALNGLEREILGELVKRDIVVHPQWGVAGYRIDFALAHRERPSEMVLAVELDGDSYHRSHSVRDRDRLRQEHLERLGWRFHRVWASTWMQNPKAEADRIVRSWQYAMTNAGKTTTPVRPTIAPARIQRAHRPTIEFRSATKDYSDGEFNLVLRYLLSDELEKDVDARIDETMEFLGKKRKSPALTDRIVAAYHRIEGERRAG